MPHYKSGELAQVGDVVKGKTYNTKGDIIGVVLEITSDSPTCNVKVVKRLSIHQTQDGLRRTVLDESGTDYGECSSFEKVA